MTAFLFDGTKIGLFTCIFESFYERRNPDVVTALPLQGALGDEVYEIKSDAEKAERVENCLQNLKTSDLKYNLSLAFKSGESIKYTVIFKYLKKAIDNKKVDISKNFADGDVLAFFDLVEKIRLEAHRLKGFLRFSETKDGYFYAHYEPDNDVTELIIPHFKSRFNFPFIIHDVKRNVVGLCDGKRYKVINYDSSVSIYLSNEEKEFEKLWKTYYNSVNIKERKNEKSMRSYMPVRYWKHALEKQENIEDF